MALPLVWQAASTGGWVAFEISGIFQNLADVQQGMQSIAAPNTMVDAPNAKTLQIKAGAIEFRQIGFGYSTERPLFERFNLTLAPGERVGLVGDPARASLHSSAFCCGCTISRTAPS